MCLGTIGVITEIRDDDGIAMAVIAAESGDELSACLLACPEAAVGETVLVHSGYVLRTGLIRGAGDGRGDHRLPGLGRWRHRPG